jgi:hypothetical protein
MIELNKNNVATEEKRVQKERTAAMKLLEAERKRIE